MSSEKNDLELSVPDSTCHMTLNILDIIRFLSELKLEYLDNEIVTEIIVSYNANVDEAYYITEGMSGLDIRDQFNKLPNAVKQKMKDKTLISDDNSRDFFTQILKNSTERYEFFIRDSTVKGSLVNMFSYIVIVTCVIIYFVYNSTSQFRGEIGPTISSKIVDAVVAYIEEKLP